MEGLGYGRFAAHANDIGAVITAFIGLDYPDRVIGIHTLMPGFPRPDVGPDDPELSQVEHAFLEVQRRWEQDEGGYNRIQETRPQTLAYGLNDSPAGLAAWIVEKFQTWSDHRGEFESWLDRDSLLTNITLYWVTGAINSSFWPYYAIRHEPWPLPDEFVETPTAYASFPRETRHPPRAFAETAFNVERWTEMERGGHFAALEVPDLLAGDVAAFFRRFRGA
jgi:microsomal epoxide hydrolase